MFIIIGGDGKEYGPVTTDQVRTWMAAGRANLETQAKAAGSEEWRRLGDYAEFAPPSGPPIVDPNAAAASGPSAGRGARIGAAFINAFFYFVCMMPGAMAMSRKLLEQYPELAEGGFSRISEIDPRDFMQPVLMVWAGLLAAILLQTILLAVRSQNIGKMLVGARVVRMSDGQRAGFLRAALLRYLLPVALIIGLNAFTVVLGFVFLLVDFCFIFREDGRCLHDLIAGTRVAKT